MKIAIAGDISITGHSVKSFEDIDETKAFGDVVDVFKSCDRVIVNLECALTDSEHKIKKYGPNLKGPKNTADTFKKAGVTDCALSNNHIFDFGIEGAVDTIKQLDRVGINWTGFGDNYNDSRKDLIIVKDGITVTVVNVCEHEYTYAIEDRMGARPFDEFETMDDIRKAKKSADYVVVIYHGGKEHCRYPSPRLLKACREMVRCGADVVLCQHSHCIGCYEKFEGGHILYGQGNFHFFKFINDEKWDNGLLAVLDITKEKIDIDFIPVVEGENGIVIAKGERKDEILNTLLERSETLHTGKWLEHWRDFCETVHSAYRSRLYGHSEESTNDDLELFAHSLDCEAHTDVFREIFKTWNHTNEKEL